MKRKYIFASILAFIGLGATAATVNKASRNKDYLVTQPRVTASNKVNNRLPFTGIPSYKRKYKAYDINGMSRHKQKMKCRIYCSKKK